jgi:hypothetical protein
MPLERNLQCFQITPKTIVREAGRNPQVNTEEALEKEEFLMMAGQYQGIQLDPDRVERMTEPGGLFDQLVWLRLALYQLDVTGYRPLHEPGLESEETES